MITGFEIGTEVKWNYEGTLTTGIVEHVFYRPELIDLDGKTVRVSVTDDSPTYLIRHHSGEQFILPHRDVFLNSMNDHTGQN